MMVYHPAENNAEAEFNSLFWFFPAVARTIEIIGGHSVSLHNCMHGGSRNKLTKWWATTKLLRCYGVFATAAIAMHRGIPELPNSSGSSIPSLTVQAYYGNSFGVCNTAWSSEPSQLTSSAAGGNHDFPQVNFGYVTKRQKQKPLVSDFQRYVHFLNTVNCDPEATSFFTAQPKATRVVQRQMQWG